MNIFHKVTLQSMKKSRTRTMVTIIGVALSAVMITAVATFAVSLQNYLIKGSEVKYGNWHVGFTDADSSFVKSCMSDQRVSGSAFFENIGYAVLKGGKNPDKPYLFLAGFEKQTFRMLPLTLVSGRLPQNSTEILIPEHAMANGGADFQTGERVTLSVGERLSGNRILGQHDAYHAGREKLDIKTEKAYTIVGIYQRPGFEEFSAPGYTAVTMADPAYKTNQFSVFLSLKNPAAFHSYLKNAAGTHAVVINDNVLRFMGLSDDRYLNTILYATAGILVLLIMTGSVFLIYNSFHISMNERIRQFGILSSVGATAGQLRESVLFEGFCIGLAGIPLGVAGGLLSIRLVISLVAGNFHVFGYSSVPLTMTVSPAAIAAAAVVSMITILISAYIPARKAAGTPVMESIRQTNEIRVEAADVRISARQERILGLPGILALKNFKRNKKQYRSIVFSLVLSIVLFVSAASFSCNLNQVSKHAVTDMDEDILFQTESMDEKEFLSLFQKLKTAKGVTAGTCQEVYSYSCAAEQTEFSQRYRASAGVDQAGKTVDIPVKIQFIDDHVYQNFIRQQKLPEKEYTGTNARLIAVAKELVTQKNKKRESFDIFAAASMTLRVSPAAKDTGQKVQEKDVSVTFLDTYPVSPPPEETYKQKQNSQTVFMVIAPFSMKNQFQAPAVHANMGLAFQSETPSVSVAEMKAMIQKDGITSGYTLYNVSAILEQNRNILFVANLFTSVFVLMISLIAVANVFNTISTNIRLRRRELAMLRSVGMSDRGFRRMMNFECIFYGLQTIVTGIPIAVLFSVLIYLGMSYGDTENVVYKFPWVSILLSAAGVFLVVFITMLYSVSKISRENIMDALRDDTA